MKIKIFFIVILTHSLLILLVLMVFNASMVNTVLTPNGNSSKLITNFLPQGWNFFTRDPRLPKYFIYTKKNGLFINEIIPCNSVKNAGFNRISRKKGGELISIMEQLKNKKWIESYGNISSINNSDIIFCEVYVVKKNKFIENFATGTYYIEKIEHIPWLWSKVVNDSKPPSQFIKIILEDV